MKRPPTTTRRNGTVRCAIYTRKSSEEGLEQEFNSLQAQREACEAFITSQRHEGWVCLRAAYDDGGFSGATMTGTAAPHWAGDQNGDRRHRSVCHRETECAIGKAASQGAPVKRGTHPRRRHRLCCTRAAGGC